MLKRRMLLPAVLAALLVAPPAQADDPFVTDPEGDAGRCTGFCVTPTLASEPSIDILAADIALQGQSLSFSIDVLDLDRVSNGPLAPNADDDVTYRFSFDAGDVRLGVTANRTYGHADPTATVSAYHYDGEDHNVFRSVPVTFDAAGSTVKIAVPLPTLNAAIDEACASCAPVGRGTVFEWVDISTVVWVTVHTGDVAGSGYLGYSNVDTAGGFGHNHTVGT